MAEDWNNKNRAKTPDGSSSRVLVRVEDITKTYSMGSVSLVALKGISLEVHPGEFVAVMGPSGSGKSTFMNILGCLDTPTTGVYQLDGIDVSKMTGDELAEIRNIKIGFVFQGFNLLARTTALENVELPMLYSDKYDSIDREERAKKALNQVNLGGRYHHDPTQLSGGEQQRVAIARALVNDPTIILADEPTGNLDTKTSFEIMNIFQKLNEEKKITVIMVTHEPDISRFAKRIVLLRDGRLLMDRPVTDRLIAEDVLKTEDLSIDSQILSLNDKYNNRENSQAEG